LTTRAKERRASTGRTWRARRPLATVLAAVAALALTAAVVTIVWPRLRPGLPVLDEANRAALAEAESHFAADRLDRAVAVAEAYLDRHPDAVGLHYVAGAALAQQGEHRRAADHLAAEVERAPGHLDSQVRLGAALSELGELEDANRALRAALDLDPASARASYLLGRNLAQARQWDAAEPLLQRAADGSTGSAAADAWHQLGLLRRERGDLAAAEKAFRTALAASSDHGGALFDLGRTLQRLGREDEAQRFLGRHAELESRRDRFELLRHHALAEGASADDLVNLGRYLLLQRDLDNADAAFQRALDRDPDHVPALIGAGQSLLERARPEEAAATLRRAVEHDPSSADAHFFLGLAQHLLRDHAVAQRSLARSRELEPWRAEEFLFFGNVLASSGSLADAELAYRSSLEVGPEIPEAHYKLGLVLQARDRPGEARTELERFIALEPRDPRGPLLLGVVEHRAGELDSAAATFERALERIEVALPDPTALDAMLAELRALPGAEAALEIFAALRRERGQPGH
jgi:tetratricopeptide (TPR) repeat protein